MRYFMIGQGVNKTDMRYIALLLVFTIGTALTGQSYQSDFIIQLSEGHEIKDVQSALNQSDCHPEVQLVNENFRLYTLSGNCLTEARLNALSAIQFVEKELSLELRAKRPNDALYTDQWQMELIRAPLAWDFSTGGQTVQGDDIVIAVLDEQYNEGHIDFGDNLWTNPNEVPDDGIDNDNNGYVDDYLGFNFRDSTDTHIEGGSHGAAVCGIIGAQGDNEEGITGVNWDVKIMMLDPINPLSKVEEAMLYVLNMRKTYNETNGMRGAYIVALNMSFGSSGKFADQDFPIMCSLIDSLGKAGVLCVASGPNDRINIDSVGDLPNDCKSEYLISVTNTDDRDDLVGNAGYGPVGIDMSAPGDASTSTGRDSSYRSFGGASAAAPYVSGSVGLIYAAACDDFISLSKTNPQAAASAMRMAILDGVDPSLDLTDMVVTGGRLNIFTSLELLNESSCTSDTNTLSGIDYIGLSATDQIVTIELVLKPLIKHKLELYDAAGRLWKEIDLDPSLSDRKTIVLNQADFPVPRATYIARLTGEGVEESKKFVVVY